MAGILGATRGRGHSGDATLQVVIVLIVKFFVPLQFLVVLQEVLIIVGEFFIPLERFIIAELALILILIFVVHDELGLGQTRRFDVPEIFLAFHHHGDVP
jgi:hypothetical protein